MNFSRNYVNMLEFSDFSEENECFIGLNPWVYGASFIKGSEVFSQEVFEK